MSHGQFFDEASVEPPPSATDFLPLSPSAEKAINRVVDPEDRIFSRASCTSPFSEVKLARGIGLVQTGGSLVDVGGGSAMDIHPPFEDIPERSARVHPARKSNASVRHSPRL